MTADLQPDLESIIRARDFSALRRKLENWEPADLASLIVSLPVEDQVIVFRNSAARTCRRRLRIP
jgi:Mg/Co/Ni transporter MgtE